MLVVAVASPVSSTLKSARKRDADPQEAGDAVVYVLPAVKSQQLAGGLLEPLFQIAPV